MSCFVVSSSGNPAPRRGEYLQHRPTSSTLTIGSSPLTLPHHRETDEIPEELKNSKSKLMLGYELRNGAGGENLSEWSSALVQPSLCYSQLSAPLISIPPCLVLTCCLFDPAEVTLADGFPLTDGKVTFTLPSDLPTRNSYIVVLCEWLFFRGRGEHFGILLPHLLAVSNCARISFLWLPFGPHSRRQREW